MRISALFAVALAPLMALCAPKCAKQGASKFCTRIVPAPPSEVTEARFNEFAYLFLVKKDINSAFHFILPEYIVRPRIPIAESPPVPDLADSPL